MEEHTNTYLTTIKIKHCESNIERAHKDENRFY